MPLTVPDVFTVAMLELLLLQVPPPVPPSANVVVVPTHKLVAPLIVPALGAAFTVTTE